MFMALKLVATIFISFFSILPKSSAPGSDNVCGLWKGYFGTINEINEISVKLNAGNKAEIICRYADVCVGSAGTYKLVGDTAIIISYLSPEKKSCEVILYGNLNRTGSFIDGQWDAAGNEKGCFYLQKQITSIAF